MSIKNNKWDKLWNLFFMIPYGFIFGFVFAMVLLGRESYNCQQKLEDPRHCQDVCVDQLLRFEKKGLITIHCQKCETKGSKQ